MDHSSTPLPLHLPCILHVCLPCVAAETAVCALDDHCIICDAAMSHQAPRQMAHIWSGYPVVAFDLGGREVLLGGALADQEERAKETPSKQETTLK